MSYYRFQKLDGEVVSNRIQEAIKGFLCQIIKRMKEFNWDGREIKGSKI